METTLALLLIAFILGFGDFISIKTKAFLAMMFVAGLLFLFGFWMFLPKTLFDDANNLDFMNVNVTIAGILSGILYSLTGVVFSINRRWIKRIENLKT